MIIPCASMAVSQYALKWDKYEENIKTFFGEIKGQSEFTDVTLVTGDGQHLDVHRLILSSFSPVLRTMFGQKSSSNTLLFLRGVVSLPQLLHMCSCGATHKTTWVP